MLKRFFVPVIIALALVGPGAWAGDAASFVDLGFSADGTRYMFAQYGVETNSLRPWAELFVVDVPRNDFVSGGRKSAVFDGPVVAGQDGSGAFYKLLTENVELAARHKVDFLRQSQPLYLAVDSADGDGAATIKFRDFEAGAAYTATLVPYVEGEGADLKSSFYIDVVRTLKDNTTRRYTVGTPGLKRPLVSAYRICRAIVAPKDGSLIFVVELKRAGKSGIDSRYMVEALRL